MHCKGQNLPGKFCGRILPLERTIYGKRRNVAPGSERTCKRFANLVRTCTLGFLSSHAPLLVETLGSTTFCVVPITFKNIIHNKLTYSDLQCTSRHESARCITSGTIIQLQKTHLYPHPSGSVEPQINQTRLLIGLVWVEDKFHHPADMWGVFCAPIPDFLAEP